MKPSVGAGKREENRCRGERRRSPGAPRGKTSFYRLEAVFENGSRQLLPGVVSKLVASAP
jgi:hypothetical protein